MSLPKTSLSLFKHLCHQSMEEVFQDWRMMLEFEVELGPTVLLEIPSLDHLLERFTGSCVAVQTRIEGGQGGPLLVLFPKVFAIRAAGAMTMLPEAAVEERVAAGLSAADMESFQELMNLFCGSWNNVFRARHKSLRISQRVEDLRITVHRPGSRRTFEAFRQEELVLLHFPITVGGHTFSIVEIFDAVTVEEIASLCQEADAA